MFATVNSSCVAGLDALPIQVELTVRSGNKRFTVLGLGGTAVRESRDRIVSALEHSGFDASQEILVNLAPAEVKKESAAFDLPIAVALACALGGVPQQVLPDLAFCGELSLTGEVKETPGITAHAVAAAQQKRKVIVVPEANSAEAAVVQGVRVLGVRTLSQVIRILNGREEPQYTTCLPSEWRHELKSFDDVVGQQAAKRALTIAAAGAHNLLMIGPPGCGKSMLAERLASLLPPLSPEERLEVLRIHSIAGQPTGPILSGVRPFRTPHYVISDVGLIGGGLGPRPGEISLAHRGVLFLDEFPEFRRTTVESLRSPLEVGSVQVARARASVNFPARFQLIAAMNPCPCGRFGSKGGGCRCPHYAIRDYIAKLSQPILDRIDMHVELESVEVEDLIAPHIAKTNDHRSLAEAVRISRERQIERYGTLNNEVSDGVIRECSTITSGARDLLTQAIKRLGMSARGYVRVLRVARTIADLSDTDRIDEETIAEAISYRSLDRLANLVDGAQSFKRTG
jgi:magnesium chelatase family protein